MDFNYSSEDESFRKELRGWLEKNIKDAPPARDVLSEEGPGAWQNSVKWHQKLDEGKWIGISWPKEYGGRGAGILQNIIYSEELARAGTGVPFTGMGISLLGPTLEALDQAVQSPHVVGMLRTALNFAA